MSADSPERRAFALYDELVALDEATRAARLDALAKVDPATAAALARMLAVDTESGPAGMALDGLAATALQAVQSALALGPAQRVGPFLLRRLLGRGGMGEVWLAERAEVDFQQFVALKLVRPDLDDGEFDARFLRERRLLARLDHPQLAALVDGGVTREGRPWFAMRYVDGQDIVTHATAQALDLRARMSLLAGLAEAAGHAHAGGIVHRDIKPANVLVPADGKPVLIDFGIARLFADDEGLLTRTQQSPMSPAYAAPEQMRRGAIGPWTDVYALALIGWELIVGRRAREHVPENAVLTLPGQAWRMQTSAQRVVMEAPCVTLDRIFARALDADPRRRHADGTALARDLQAWLAGQPVDVRTRSLARRSWIKPGWRLAGALVAAVMLVAAAILWWLDGRQPASRGADAIAEAAASLAPDQQAAYLRAVGLASVGDVSAREAALPLLRNLVAARPDFMPALELLSSLVADLAWQQRLGFAAALAEQRELAALAARVHPGSIEARALALVADFGAAQAKPDRPSYAAVLARAQALMDAAPQRLDVLLIATDTSGVLGQIEQAVVLARRAEAMAPHDERAIIMLARALYALGRHDEADAAAARARSLSPRRGDTYAYASGRYVDVGLYDRAWAAIEACRRAQADRCEHLLGALGFQLRLDPPAGAPPDPLAATWREKGIAAVVAQLDAQGADLVRRRAVDVISWALAGQDATIALDVLRRRSPALLDGAEPLPHETDFGLMHGIALSQLGRAADAHAAFTRVLSAIDVLPFATRSALPQLPDVSALAWLGREEEALARLAAYVEAGWSSERAFTEARGGIADPLITPLAGNSRFQALIQQVRERNAAAAAKLPEAARPAPTG